MKGRVSFILKEESVDIEFGVEQISIDSRIVSHELLERTRRSGMKKGQVLFENIHDIHKGVHVVIASHLIVVALDPLKRVGISVGVKGVDNVRHCAQLVFQIVLKNSASFLFLFNDFNQIGDVVIVTVLVVIV